MSQELLQVQRCPGCDTLHRTAALTHPVLLFQQPWGYREALICDECWQRVEAPATPTKRPASRARTKVTE